MIYKLCLSLGILLLAAPSISHSQTTDEVIDRIIPNNRLVARFSGSDLLGELGYGALKSVFGGGRSIVCNPPRGFLDPYNVSQAIKCDKFYLDYENSNSAAFVGEESGEIALVAGRGTLEPFAYFGSLGGDSMKIRSERDARRIVDSFIREAKELSPVKIPTPPTLPARGEQPEPRESIKRALEIYGWSEDVTQDAVISVEFAAGRPVKYSTDPPLFIAVNTQEGWKFYWLITVNRDRYNPQRGWESNILSHVLIDAVEPRVELFDITPLGFTIGYTPSSDAEKKTVAEKAKKFIDLFLGGSYISIDTFDGATVCKGDLISKFMCSLSSEKPEGKKLFAITDADSAVITDSEGNLLFVSSQSGKAFSYVGFVAAFTDVHGAYDVVRNAVTTNKPLKLSFIAVRRSDEFRMLYAFFNVDVIKIIDATTGEIVY